MVAAAVMLEDGAGIGEVGRRAVGVRLKRRNEEWEADAYLGFY